MKQEWVVFLRAVNVSGKGKLPMAAFREVLSSAGFDNVRTYIQTGNALFSSALSREEIEEKVQTLLVEHFNLSRPALAMKRGELQDALKQNPFPEAHEIPQRLHLMFLKGEVKFDAEAFSAICDSGEEFALINQVFYLYTPNGAGKSKAANRYEKFVQSEMITARNLNSCNKIAALFEN